MAQESIAISTTPPLPGTQLVEQANDALKTVATDFSGSIDPGALADSYMTWADTGTGDLKRRNAANNGWDVIGRIFPQTTEDASGNVSIAGSLTVDGNTLSAPVGIFAKSDPSVVAWKRPTGDTVQTNQELVIEVDGSVYTVAENTSVSLPTLTTGTDYAIWIEPDGSLIASTSFSSTGGVGEAATGSRKVGGFHYAPGGNASLDAAGNWANHTGGNNTPQINEYSFYDLKFKPSAPDPRGLTLVNNSFWVGMYLMSATTTVAPLHKYNVNPARDGNPPQKPYGNGTTYGNARPMNIFECLAYYGFRAPNHNEFQLLALGTTEQTSLGGSGPGNTGVLTSGAGTKERFTSAWGVFDATGVLLVWGRDSLPDNTQDNNVTEGRSNNIWRISRFAFFGGDWISGAGSGSRFAAPSSASTSTTGFGGRGVCDHLILV